MTSIQQLFQLSVSIAFNFLGNWVDPVSRRADGKMERVCGRSSRVRAGSAQERGYFLPGRSTKSGMVAQWYQGPILSQMVLPFLKWAPISRFSLPHIQILAS